MRYGTVAEGVFLRRMNRFVAWVQINGVGTTCHVKNTGRLKELFVSGARCVLAAATNPHRATAYDLVGIWRGDVLVNVDSQAPNAAAREWVAAGGLGDGVTLVRPEYTWGNSRFDLYAERSLCAEAGPAGTERLLIEVKGVTLNVDGEARFPDAPTTRGVKHVQELMHARQQGYRACIVFVIQMPDVVAFAPNDATHPEFGEALRDAARAGVEIHAVLCRNAPDSMVMTEEVPVRL